MRKKFIWYRFVKLTTEIVNVALIENTLIEKTLQYP